MSGNDKAIATIDNTTARVVESVILRGDISGLSNAERANYYTQLCESMGLNPASQPFAPLRLNGKEILYPTRTTTDQLAKIHKVNREIIDGPKLIKLGETQLVYALCRASMPDGRFETATATVPFTDPTNVLMKCETKAKRRATLSILGLGMLDETELETIPSHLKSDAMPIDLNAAESTFVQRIHAIAEAGYGNAALTAEQAVGVYFDALDAVGGTVSSDDEHEGVRAAQSLRDKSIPLRAFNDAFNDEHVKRSAPLAENDALPNFKQAVNEIELAVEAVAVWLQHRAALAAMRPKDRDAAWKYICERVEEVGGVKNAKVWLKRAIALEDTRRSRAAQPSDDSPPSETVALPPTETPAPVVLPPLEALTSALADAADANAVVDVWIAMRARVATLGEGERAKAWENTQQAYGLLVSAKDPIALRQMLKAAIARRESTPPDDSPRGGNTHPQAPSHVDANGSAHEAARSEQLAALRAYLAKCDNWKHVENGVDKHRGEWPLITEAEVRDEVINRMGELRATKAA